jgi:hypothetical protein
VPEGGEGVMQPWRIEGAHPEDRVSGVECGFPRKCGFYGSSAGLDNSMQAK